VSRPACRIAPSILAADFGRLADDVARAAEAGADLLHVDVMDGHFVPNITIGPPVVAALRKATSLPLDVHLMITDPLRYAPAFIDAGASSISVHQETCADLGHAIETLHDARVQAAVVVNPDTPVDTVTDVMPMIDMLLIMSVHPGFGGQRFIEGALDKIRTAATQRAALGATFAIEVDGGITAATAARAAVAGADVFVAGTAIFGERDYGQAIASMRQAIAGAIASAR
jgi:ribulose-phosphate 3-epimerase